MIQRMLFVIIVVITRSFGTVLFDIVIFRQLKTEKENFFFSNTVATLPAALFVKTKRPLSSHIIRYTSSFPRILRWQFFNATCQGRWQD